MSNAINSAINYLHSAMVESFNPITNVDSIRHNLQSALCDLYAECDDESRKVHADNYKAMVEPYLR